MADSSATHIPKNTELLSYASLSEKKRNSFEKHSSRECVRNMPLLAALRDYEVVYRL